MIKTVKLLILCICCLGMTTTPSYAAAVDYFLELDGIDGESQDATHPETIEILSWSWGVDQQANGLAAGVRAAAARRRTASTSFTMRKHVDASTPKLMQYCADGKHIRKVTLFARTAESNPVEYLIIHMDNVLVSSFSTAGTAADTVPVESVSFNYERVRVVYSRQDDSDHKGETLEYGWPPDSSTSKR